MYILSPLKNIVLQQQGPHSSVGRASEYELKRLGSSPAAGKDFSFCIFRFPRLLSSWTLPIQVKSSMSFIRGNKCIERG